MIKLLGSLLSAPCDRNLAAALASEYIQWQEAKSTSLEFYHLDGAEFGAPFSTPAFLVRDVGRNSLFLTTTRFDGAYLKGAAAVELTPNHTAGRVELVCEPTKEEIQASMKVSFAIPLGMTAQFALECDWKAKRAKLWMDGSESQVRLLAQPHPRTRFAEVLTSGAHLYVGFDA